MWQIDSGRCEFALVRVNATPSPTSMLQEYRGASASWISNLGDIKGSKDPSLKEHLSSITLHSNSLHSSITTLHNSNFPISQVYQTSIPKLQHVCSRVCYRVRSHPSFHLTLLTIRLAKPDPTPTLPATLTAKMVKPSVAAEPLPPAALPASRLPPLSARRLVRNPSSSSRTLSNH